MSAVLSDCGNYRYRLTRSVGMGNRAVTFVGVNPSTADANVDDATVRKWAGFSRRWGFDRFEVVNLFAFRSTDVRALATAADPVGPDNDMHILSLLAESELVVPCWGNSGKLPQNLRGRMCWLHDRISESGVEAKCFGLTKSGDPKHPLMLGYDTELQPWP